jgi:hypothetical protein
MGTRDWGLGIGGREQGAGGREQGAGSRGQGAGRKYFITYSPIPMPLIPNASYLGRANPPAVLAPPWGTHLPQSPFPNYAAWEKNITLPP